MVTKENLKQKKEPNDNSLIRKIVASGCNESYSIISQRHERLFYKICQKYIPAVKMKGLSAEDLLNEKHFVIFKAISSYRKDKKNKFSTWLGNCTKYFCLTFLNSENKYIKLENEMLDICVNKDEEGSFDEGKKLKEDKDYIFRILDKLKDKRISKVFELRYFDEDLEKNKTAWSKIALKINTSTQTAINLHKKGVRVLNKKFKAKIHPDII